jgi:cysteine desulfurase
LGGGQEGGLRSGTLNVPGIVGLAEAVRLQHIEGQARAQHVRHLAKAFLDVIIETGISFHLNGHPEQRLPGNLNLWFEGVEAEQLILSLPGIVFSNGSACNSRALTPSHVLTAIGCDRERAFESVRISFSKDNNLEEVVRAARQIAERVKELRQISPSTHTRSVNP